MLFIVPTPIGNLEDITYRAVKVLNSVDVIFCEDTRKTLKLLSKYNIKTSVKRYNEHSKSSLEFALEFLRNGKKAALVSDGGTPCISDPGYKLVLEARKAKIKITSLAGASSVTSALAASGFGGGSFAFLGFLPRKKNKALSIIKTSFALEKPVIIFESPHRIIKLLAILKENFTMPMPAVVCREISKIYEEYIGNTVEEIYTELSSRKKILGEIVLVLNPADKICKL